MFTTDYDDILTHEAALEVRFNDKLEEFCFRMGPTANGQRPADSSSK